MSKQEEFHLSASSLCVNGGVPVERSVFGEAIVDYDGEPRPAPLVGTDPEIDIGADELS